jgi:hypothetical protein
MTSQEPCSRWATKIRTYGLLRVRVNGDTPEPGRSRASGLLRPSRKITPQLILLSQDVEDLDLEKGRDRMATYTVRRSNHGHFGAEHRETVIFSSRPTSTEVRNLSSTATICFREGGGAPTVGLITLCDVQLCTARSPPSTNAASTWVVPTKNPDREPIPIRLDFNGPRRA